MGKIWVQYIRTLECTRPIEMLSRVQFCTVFIHISTSQQVQYTLRSTLVSLQWLGEERRLLLKKLSLWVWKQIQGSYCPKWGGRYSLRLLSNVFFFLDVLQCIPTCAISSFHILVGLCSELNKKMSNFWWEQLLTSYFLTIQNWS